MADVTGPISTLSGSSHAVPKGTMCDEHPGLVAAHRIQGETDSMGCEMIDMCEFCYQEHLNHVKNADTSGTCDWCKEHKPKLRDRRDYEEGMCGRVYQVCDSCVAEENARLDEELDDYDDYDYFDYGDYD